MCGIFGFAFSEPLKMSLALKVLTLLETHQYSNEVHPVGGHGAGIYSVSTDGKEVFAKVGKTNGSPAKLLAEKILERKSQTKLFIGHVRWASPSFLKTIASKECAQPYVAACCDGLKVVSVHNGFVENYGELHTALCLRHKFESEQAGEFIDSEVIPHFLEESLCSKVAVAKALNALSAKLANQRGNTVGMLLVENNKPENFLVFMHQGRTRGLTVWTNPDREVMFSSRKTPVKKILGEFLRKHGFEEKISVGWKELKHVNPMIFPLSIDVFAE